MHIFLNWQKETKGSKDNGYEKNDKKCSVIRLNKFKYQDGKVGLDQKEGKFMVPDQKEAGRDKC